MSQSKPYTTTIAKCALLLSLALASACSNAGNTGNPGISGDTGNGSNAGASGQTTANQGSEQPGAGSSLKHDFAALPGDWQPEPGASLLIWESKEARPFAEQIMQEFTAIYGVPVRMEEVGTMDQVGRLELDGPNGTGADIITTSQDLLGKAATAGLLLPNDIFAEATAQANEEAAVRAASYGDTLYGYPIKVMTYAMFYNKALIPEPPATLEEVVAFAAGFNDPDANRYAFMFDVPFFYFSYPFIASTGGYIFGDNGTNPGDIGLNNDGAVRGMQQFAALRQSTLPISAGDIASDIKTALFSEGSVAMNVTGSWFIETFRSAGIDFGIAPIPSIGGEPSVSLSQVNSWYVSAFSRYPKAAKLFAAFASTKEAQLLNYELTGAIPTNKEAGADSKVMQDPIASAFYEQFSRSHPAPSIPEIASVWTPMDAAMVEIWDGEDVKATLDRAVRNITDAIQLNRQQGEQQTGKPDSPF